MIDIHTHIIFGVDDGAKTLEDSIKILEDSAKKGVTTIVATSHRRESMFETDEEIITENFEILKKEIKSRNIPIKLYFGAEIYYNLKVLKRLECKIYPTLANTDYILLEFSPKELYRNIKKAIESVVLLGYKPIIAHIERYFAFEDIECVKEVVSRGAYIQINSSSVLKPKIFGDKEKIFKKRAANLLKQDLVHFVASDVHNMNDRKSFLDSAYLIIKKKYGEKRALDLFERNQQKLINNEII